MARQPGQSSSSNGAQVPPILAIRCKLGKNAVGLCLDPVLLGRRLLPLARIRRFCIPTPHSAPPTVLERMIKPHQDRKAYPWDRNCEEHTADDTSSGSLLGLVQQLLPYLLSPPPCLPDCCFTPVEVGWRDYILVL